MQCYIVIVGFTTRDWFKTKLNHAEVLLALKEMAKFHACGLAYRMSLKVTLFHLDKKDNKITRK